MARKRKAPPALTVQITDENYERARRSKSGGCLIADAIKTQYPHLTRVTVDMATIRATDREAGERYTWLCPNTGQHLLLSYDQGWPKPINEVSTKRAVVVTPVTKSETEEERAEKRAARLAELEEKIASGEELTTGEKRALGNLRNPKPAPPRPKSRGKADVKVASNGEVVVYGGRPPLVGEAHPNLLRGSDRHFGAKLADPGLAFREAVEAAVAERLAEEEEAE